VTRSRRRAPGRRLGRSRRAAAASGLLLVVIAAQGCAVSPAQREATERAWAERDAARASACQSRGGRFVAGGCAVGGGP
jgi:hypothetical protein